MYDQYDEVCAVASLFPNTEKVVATNRRVIFRCPSKGEANTLALNLKSNRFTCDVEKGLKSDHFYVQVHI